MTYLDEPVGGKQKQESGERLIYSSSNQTTKKLGQ